jgi:chromosome segregation ATPase
MSKPTIKSLTEQLEIGKRQYQSVCKEKNATQFLLDNANKEVAQLLQLKAELMKVVETLKEEKETLNSELGVVRGILGEKLEENEQLKSEYSQLEDNYNILSKHHDDLIYKFNENLVQHKAIEAETHALKAEIERTNRHINLAENQLHKEQQPTIVNHYHNCVINK